jgi:hypothetical protein
MHVKDQAPPPAVPTVRQYVPVHPTADIPFMCKQLCRSSLEYSFYECVIVMSIRQARRSLCVLI